MGLTNDPEDLELHSVRDEESLPLYSELGTKEPTEVPDLEASPEAVRDFFKALLITKRQESVENADKVAALWMRGSGRELKSYPPTMYLKIFGSEDGWFLYREMQLIKTKEEPGAKRVRTFVKFTVLASMLIWEFSMVMLGITTTEPGLMGLAIMGGIFGTLGLIGAAVFAFATELTPEDRIENELRACMAKMGDTP